MKVLLQEFLKNVPSRVKSTRRCFKVRTLHNQKQDGFRGMISTGLVGKWLQFYSLWDLVLAQNVLNQLETATNGDQRT